MRLSLKWKIQLWHALILACVLGVLGFGFYFYEKGQRIAKIDAQLNASIHPLKGPLVKFADSRESFHGGHPPHRKSPRDQNPGRKKRENDVTHSPLSPNQDTEGWLRVTSDSNKTKPRMSGKSRGNDQTGPHRKFEQDLVPKGFYGMASRRDSEIASYRSSNFPEIDIPESIGNGSFVRWRDANFREVYHEQNQFQILVGYDVRIISDSLHLLKLQLLGGLFAVFGFAILVGHFLVSRAIKPLSGIEAAAAKIAQGQLSERVPKIPESGATELKNLSSNLNETFTQLENSFQRQTRFTADASHELRTPLTALLAQIEHGLKRSRSAEEYANILEVCKRSSTRIRRITEQLIELSRYDSGRVEMETEEVLLEPMMISLAEELTPYIYEHGHELQTEITSGEFTCDPFRLEQVITNLINNAIQHNEKPTTITLRARLEVDQCVIEVSDTGIGIQPENIDKLFSRFFQESASRTKVLNHTNVGLGLSISEAIVKAHGGKIKVTSEPNINTTFRITLPLA